MTSSGAGLRPLTLSNFPGISPERGIFAPLPDPDIQQLGWLRVRAAWVNEFFNHAEVPNPVPQPAVRQPALGFTPTASNFPEYLPGRTIHRVIE